MQAEAVVVERALRFSTIFTKEYIKAPETRGPFFCSFESCGQLQKKSGRIILEI